ncbi:MAG: glycine cleavage system protein GcvH [Planctomycetes bacterium]|nr:glycine cleavage system protein GcvH [Planctomycetota bacterium]
MRPSDRKYTESHEWVKVEGDVATIGITDYAIEHLDELVYLDLPEAGDSVTRGEPFGEIESVKAQSDIYSMLTGEVIETNAALADNLDDLMKDPFGTGWMIRVKIEHPAELETGLKGAEDYEKFLASL